MTLKVENRFYVYEHIRLDTGAIFYVGKGTGNRCFVKSHHHRSQFWQRVVQKAGGFSVNIFVKDIDEKSAFIAEQERISQLRADGIQLCNMTDGGDGTSGWIKTAEWRQKVGAKHKGKIVSAEVRAKISASVKAVGYVHSKETRQKMSDAMKGHQKTLGFKHSEETKQKMSAVHVGNKSRLGQTRTLEERTKQSLTMRGKSQAVLTCPHCNKSGGNIMRYWHFENCKENK